MQRVTITLSPPQVRVLNKLIRSAYKCFNRQGSFDPNTGNYRAAGSFDCRLTDTERKTLEKLAK